MRIAVLTNAYPPDAPGGAATIASEQVRMLEAAGEIVRVWHPPVPWFSEPSPLRLLRHLADLFAASPRVEEIVAWKPDVLLTHNLTGCGFGTPQAVQKRGVRWVHVLHDIQLFSPSGQARSVVRVTLWQRFWSALRKCALGKPDLVLSPTQWLLDQHRRRGFFARTSATVLPNPGPSLVRAPRTAHEPLRLLFVGRIAEDKGAYLLGRIISSLAIPCELDVIGQGPVFLEDERVTFHGPLAHEDVLRAMRAADVFLLPSQIVENQPTVLLEAAAQGLPVIASDIGGVAETLGGAGILCKPEQVAAWVMAIRSLADATHYRDCSEGMYAMATQHEPARYAHRFVSLLTSNR